MTPSSTGNHADDRQARGHAGEVAALKLLRRRGYRVLATNYRSRYGEIDIIVRLGQVVAFVEVKARRNKLLGEPFEAVGPRKQSQIRRMAEIWLAQHQRDPAYADCCFRFDVISIMLDENNRATTIEHLEDAFQ